MTIPDDQAVMLLDVASDCRIEDCSIGDPAEQKPSVPAEKLAWEKILPGT